MTRTTTVVYSPHPDDETLRLSGYLTTRAAADDRLLLVAVSDGGATALTGLWGWDRLAMEAARSLEQTWAWHALTGGRGTIAHLRLPDGELSQFRPQITTTAADLEAQYGPDVAHYVAAHDDDTAADHLAVVEAVRAARPRVVRVARSTEAEGGTKYMPPDEHWMAEAKRAASYYRLVGWRSVPTSFHRLEERDYASWITH